MVVAIKSDERNVSRKQQILAAAIELLSSQGYYKTTTADVAKKVGVTQPYLYHFFKSKEDLFIAVIEQTLDRVYQEFMVVEAPQEQLLAHMGNAFSELLLSNRDALLLSMQAFTISETAIREKVREGFSNIFDGVKNKFLHAGIPYPELEASRFIGNGLVITVSEVLQLPKILPPC